MRPVFKKIAISFLVVAVGIQFIPIGYNTQEATSKIDIGNVYDLPIHVRSILQTSCYDCHSNQTKYPWYSKVQPIGMFMQRHIEKGKEELNLSEFGVLSNRMKRNKLKSMISQIKDDNMPLQSYLLLHKKAILDSSDKALIVNCLDSLRIFETKKH